MGRLRCCLLVFLLPVVFCVDFREGSRQSSRSLSFFAKSSQLGQHHIARRSLGHKVNKRSTDQGGDTCNALQGYQSKLADNTHSVSHCSCTCEIRTHSAQLFIYCCLIGLACLLFSLLFFQRYEVHWKIRV